MSWWKSHRCIFVCASATCLNRIVKRRRVGSKKPEVLYPAIEPYQTHRLEVANPHELYIEECGNPDGLAVVFLHGGPGSGCEAWHRQFFDPQKYRIILFDQRGSGRSTPHAELTLNRTQDLVADMEQIRTLLGIEQWLVFGGSWGSTLALVYAQSHPEQVLGLILRGIFLCRPREIDWFYRDGASRLFADHWRAYLDPIRASIHHDPVVAYHALLTSEHEATRIEAANAWSRWEGLCATLRHNPDVVDHYCDPHTAVSLARIECHYFMHDAFLEENQILHNANRLRHIPGVIVQGRYDVICPMESAWSLHEAWPESTLKLIEDAGHSAAEPGILKVLVDACDEFVA
ncbi:MAG TPA: prolyl aminopeptidase [Chromatiales bacterium]|nr:prolyl aminopeptidase [Chromatiales bacterium]